MPRVPFAFDFESDQSNDNSVTKQLPNYHLAVSEKSVEQPSAIQLFDQLYPNLTNGNSASALLPNYHLVIQTQTQTQTEPEVFRKHLPSGCNGLNITYKKS